MLKPQHLLYHEIPLPYLCLCLCPIPPSIILRSNIEVVEVMIVSFCTHYCVFFTTLRVGESPQPLLPCLMVGFFLLTHDTQSVSILVYGNRALAAKILGTSLFPVLIVSTCWCQQTLTTLTSLTKASLLYMVVKKNRPQDIVVCYFRQSMEKVFA